jgi:hypothetical protein
MLKVVMPLGASNMEWRLKNKSFRFLTLARPILKDLGAPPKAMGRAEPPLPRAVTFVVNSTWLSSSLFFPWFLTSIL